MIGLGSGKLEHRLNISFLKIRVVLQDVFLRESSRKKIQEIRHPHSHATNAWAPPALLRIDGDTAHEAHDNRSYRHAGREINICTRRRLDRTP